MAINTDVFAINWIHLLGPLKFGSNARDKILISDNKYKYLKGCK